MQHFSLTARHNFITSSMSRSDHFRQWHLLAFNPQPFQVARWSFVLGPLRLWLMMVVRLQPGSSPRRVLETMMHAILIWIAHPAEVSPTVTSLKAGSVRAPTEEDHPAQKHTSKRTSASTPSAQRCKRQRKDAGWQVHETALSLTHLSRGL